MKIALLHYAAPPIVGGVEAVISHQADQLKHAGHQVTVLAGRGATWDEQIPVTLRPHLDSRDPEILVLKASLDRGLVPAGFELMVEAILADLQRLTQDVNVLIAHNVASLHKNLALTAALYRLSQSSRTNGTGTPLRIILWHHDLAWTAPRYRTELHTGYPWDLLRTAWQGVRQVVVSQTRREELANLTGLAPDCIIVVPAGIDVPNFLHISASTVEVVERLGLTDAAPLLLTPVRITRRKNLELAFAVLSSLHRQMPQAMLVITGPPGAHNPGNDGYLHELQELRSRLNLGRTAHLLAELRPEGLDDEEVVDFYHLADALLLPSREEGFGIPILEAGLARIPIFCTDLTPLRDLAKDWATYFSPDADPEAVAQQIASCLSNDPVYQMRLRVRRSFSWQAIYQKWISPLLSEVP